MATEKLRPCPECGSEDLAIDSCSSLSISEVACNDCTHKFHSGAFEENIWR
jgi:Zn finger protein HypA/HybF involved in hydrogenase expression